MIDVMNPVGAPAAPFCPASVTALSASRIAVVVIAILALVIATAFSKRGSIAEEQAGGPEAKPAA